MSKILATNNKGKTRQFSLLAWSALPAHKYGWSQVNQEIKTPPEAIKAVKAKVEKLKPEPLKKVTKIEAKAGAFDAMSVKELIDYIDSHDLDQSLKPS